MVVLTRDNPHLSEVTADDRFDYMAAAFAVDCKSVEAGGVAEEVRRLIQAATAPNTRRAYRSDLAHFLGNGGVLPAPAANVAGYLARFGDRLAIATLARRLVAIGRAHTSQGLANPCQADLVRLTMRGIRRTYGRPQRQALALTMEQMKTLIVRLGHSPHDLRDRALLLMGFHGAFRRSELSAVDCKSVVRSRQGMVITIRKSKTDQERKGRELAISRSGGEDCPIRALDCWVESAGITEGPYFAQSIGLAGSPGRLYLLKQSALSSNGD